MSVNGRTPRGRSLRTRTLVPAFLIGVALVAIALAGLKVVGARYLADQRLLRSRAIAHSVERLASSASRTEDLRRLVLALGHEDDVALIVLASGTPPRVLASTREDWNDRPVASLGQAELAAQVALAMASRKESLVPLDHRDVVSFCAPAALDGTGSPPAATVLVQFDCRAMRAQVDAPVRTVAVLLILLLAAGLIAVEQVLRSLVIAPIGAITAAAHRRRDGDRSAEVPVLADDELGRLAATLNEANRDSDEAARRLEYQVFALDQAAVVSVTDPTGKIVYVNDRFCALSGYSRPELMGQTHRVVGSDHHPPEFFAGMWAAISAGHVWHGEIRNRAKDGSPFWVSATIIPSIDGEGRIERFTGAYHDITARVREEQAARDSELRTRLVVDSALDAVINMDQDGRITAWNAQAERTFGWTSREAVGRSLSETIVPTHLRRAHEHGLERFRQTGQGAVLGQRVEVAAVRRNGEEFPVELAITPLATATGHVFSAFVRDISERKRAEAELVQAKEAAQQASRAKSEFLATMSHEIRTPMNGVIGFTDLLLDSPLDPAQREYAETIRHSGHALLALINDILDFSKIEAGRLDVECEPFEAREAAAEVVELLAGKARAGKLELVFDWQPGAPSRLVGDVMRFRQVLLNLLGNAIKFTEAGTVAIRVEPADGGQLRVAVEDTGIGIAGDKLATLFRKFTQADSSTTRRFGGTGLGLAICKQLVELMDGQIGVDSRPGSGSTFWFTLPIAAEAAGTKPATVLPPEAAAPQAPPAGCPHMRAAAAESVVSPMFKGIRVLVAEDQLVNQKLAVKVLARAGCTVDVASNGLEACEMIEAHDYALVFMDCHMPLRDGYEATTSVRAWETAALAEGRQRRHLPIVALTASVLKADRDRCFASGMDDFISKPFRPEQLQGALLRWASRGDSEGTIREAA